MVALSALIPPQEAIDDKAILPLLYEARIDNLSLDANIDEWFEKYTAGLAEDKQAKYKRKFSHTAVIGKARRVIAAALMIFINIFLDNYKSTGLTAQLVAPDKKTAVKYKKRWMKSTILKRSNKKSPAK